MPDALFDLIASKLFTPPPTTATPIASRVDPITGTDDPTTATPKELQYIKALCFCLSISQLDNHATSVRAGVLLKKVDAPLSLREKVSKRSKTYKLGVCTNRCPDLPSAKFFG